MNKLMGFYELKDSGLSCVKWEKFDGTNVKLDSELLWTVRTAINSGDDLNLPRKVGVSANEAYSFATEINQQLKDKGMVIIYPYFIAEKSGTLEVNGKYIVIEAVEADLWNLVSENKKDVTIYESEEKNFIDGNKDFLTEDEYSQIKIQIPKIKRLFKDLLLEGKSILLEWSYAYNTNVENKKLGEEYLVFYEIRSI